MTRDIIKRFDAIQLSFADHKKAFEEYISVLFSSELDYSFIQNHELRTRLEKHSVRMSFYKIGLGHSEDDSFENYCVYVYHQLEGLINYYFLRNYDQNIDAIKYQYIEMKIKSDYIRFMRTEDKIDYDRLVNFYVNESTEKASESIDNMVNFNFISDYQNMSEGKINDPFIKKYEKVFTDLKLVYYSKDSSARQPDNNSFVKRVWKIENKTVEIERIKFQEKMQLLLWVMNPEENFLNSPIKRLADWRNQELMHTSTTVSSSRISSFKEEKNYIELLDLLCLIRQFVSDNTK